LLLELSLGNADCFLSAIELSISKLSLYSLLLDLDDDFDDVLSF